MPIYKCNANLRIANRLIRVIRNWQNWHKIRIALASPIGFTLIETLVGTAVFLLIAVGIYESYSRLSQAVELARAKAVATAVINDDIELIRNFPYEDVGIQGSIPSGSLGRTATVVRSGFEFSITRTIRNIDDPYDGTIGGSPNDTAPADYKLVEISLVCANCRSFTASRVTTTVAPKNLEISTGGGAIFIRVFDANGVGVPQADVHVVNQKLEPDLIIDDVTNNQGILFLVDVPQSVGGYNITATKSGYSTDQTYPPGGSENPNPVKTDSTVEAGEVTQVSFFIDRVSSVNVSTANQFCAVVPNVVFHVEGSKLIGENPNILKYSLDTSTDSSGTKILSDLEWDVYAFTIIDANYDLSGFIPLLPLNLSPNTTQNLKLILSADNPKSLLVSVKDASSGLPITGATVQLTRNGFSRQGITGQGSVIQSDWSGGAGQTDFVDPARFYNSDGNIDISGPAGEIKLRRIGGDYQPSGWLESSTFDTGSASDFHILSWAPQDQPPETGPDAVKFQIASNNDNATWNFVGPDGLAASYYTLANQNLSNHNGRRFLRYRVFLSTQDLDKTPNVSDISFTFTSECVPPGQVFYNNLSSGTYTLTVSHPNYQTWSNDEVQISPDWQSMEVLMNP